MSGGVIDDGQTQLERELTEALRAVVDPELGADIVELGMVRALSHSDGVVHVDVALTIAGCPLRDQLHRDIVQALEGRLGVRDVQVTTAIMEPEERRGLLERARRLAQDRARPTAVPQSARVLGIVSGKGGVGKSTISVNLAVALASRGLTVGLLDADIWGFSVPRMVGITASLEAREGLIIPVDKAVGPGVLRVVSMGFLSGEDDAVMWRGLMLNRAVQHFLEDVEWGKLDYLVVDMPPGTGDIQMGLARMLPRTELLVVTTPALAAQKVAGRAADMARRGHLRVVGVIENMAGFTSADGVRHELFGSGGGGRLSDEVGAPLIAEIPLDPAIAAGGDSGEPVALDPTTGSGVLFAELARRVAEIAPRVDLSSCSARLLDAVGSFSPRGRS